MGRFLGPTAKPVMHFAAGLLSFGSPHCNYCRNCKERSRLRPQRFTDETVVGIVPKEAEAEEPVSRLRTLHDVDPNLSCPGHVGIGRRSGTGCISPNEQLFFGYDTSMKESSFRPASPVII